MFGSKAKVAPPHEQKRLYFELLAAGGCFARPITLLPATKPALKALLIADMRSLSGGPREIFVRAYRKLSTFQLLTENERKRIQGFHLMIGVMWAKAEKIDEGQRQQLMAVFGADQVYSRLIDVMDAEDRALRSELINEGLLGAEVAHIEAVELAERVNELSAKIGMKKTMTSAEVRAQWASKERPHA